MDEIKFILEDTFTGRIFDNQSKKKFKLLAQDIDIGNEDLNFCIKTAFDLVNATKQEARDIFILDWLRDVVNTVNDLKSAIQTVSEVQFSPINDCTLSIINFIKSAQKSIYICVFTISDDRISEQILAKHKEGIEIKIISDDDKQFDKGSDIQELANVGIEVRVDESPHHMHHKFAIIDKCSLLTGSYNWTRSAAKFNQENLIIIKDAYAVKRYLDEFYRLWKTSVSLERS